MARVYANNAVSTFTAAITNSQTTITLTNASKFPTLTAGNTCQLTFSDAATNNIIEVVTCTAIAGNVITVIRGQEGTTAQAYNAGDNCSQRTTALELSDFASLTFGGAFQSAISAPTITSTGLIYGNGGTAFGYGNLTVSASAPSGGANGDIWFQT